MVQHNIATFSLYIWIILFITWIIFSLTMGIIWVLFIAISPYILDKEYEMKLWKQKYLSNNN